MIKSALMLAFAVALAPMADAQLYKYVDKDGKTVYSDSPPPGVDTKAVSVPGAGAGGRQKSAVERDKEADKARKATAESSKKSSDAVQRSAQSEERCTAARNNYQIYQDGGRIMTLNSQGEREYLTDEQIEAKRESSRREMEEACKKS